jgi:hypothetical protein
MNDVEFEMGVFVIGKRYYVRTPTYHYTGRLSLFTGSVFVFEEASTVYESGPYEEFFQTGGRPQSGGDVQPHVGAGRLIIDRGGSVLIELIDGK